MTNSNVIPFTREREIDPISNAIDSIMSFETDNMRWLRLVSEKARRANLESQFDCVKKERK